MEVPRLERAWLDQGRESRPQGGKRGRARRKGSLRSRVVPKGRCRGAEAAQMGPGPGARPACVVGQPWRREKMDPGLV